jgi:ribosomal-protein-alanine N-acetyltransferase
LEVGYTIIPSERMKGYGTEAVKLMINYLFSTKNVCRIQAMTDTRNKPSQKILERNGFVKEGVLRKFRFTRGEFVDKYIYSIIREEWKK